jgi:hypothetical protein
MESRGEVVSWSNEGRFIENGNCIGAIEWTLIHVDKKIIWGRYNNFFRFLGEKNWLCK